MSWTNKETSISDSAMIAIGTMIMTNLKAIEEEDKDKDDYDGKSYLIMYVCI
jgi:hypothetical protein